MTTDIQIFLSYAEEDREQVKSLYEKLAESGFAPWMDVQDILPGEQWANSIRRAIRNSDFFLMCISNHSVNKRGWIQREIRVALDVWEGMLPDDIYLIPVRLEECRLPEILSGYQWVSLFEEDGWQRLLASLREGLARRGAVGP